jgi:short-subunit dehydrogenase
LSHISAKVVFMANLADEVAVVTGASSGIGAALARALSHQGARVTMVARRLKKLNEISENCPGDVQVIAADLTQETDRRRIIQQTLDRWGRIDILVNNAGQGMYGNFISTTEADWRQIFEINLFSPVFLSQSILPIMQAQRKGLIINIASIGGLIAHSEKVTAYVASKHALVGFSRALALDFKDNEIRVLAVCPHLTDTEFFRTSKGAPDLAPIVERYRNFMDTPEDVARGIIEQLDSDRVVIFPTPKPAKAYEKQRDI